MSATSESRPNRPPAEAVEAELTAENEQQHDLDSGPVNKDSMWNGAI